MMTWCHIRCFLIKSLLYASTDDDDDDSDERERKNEYKSLYGRAIQPIDWSRILFNRKYNLFVICLTFFFHIKCRKHLWTMNFIESYLRCQFIYLFIKSFFFFRFNLVCPRFIAMRMWSRLQQKLMPIVTSVEAETHLQKERKKKSESIWKH